MYTSQKENPGFTNLVWDWARGEVIDPTTGEVVDVIYDTRAPVRDDNGVAVLDAYIVTPADPLHPLHLPEPAYAVLSDIVALFVYLKTYVQIPCSTYLFEDTLRLRLKSLEEVSVKSLTDEVSMLAMIYIVLEDLSISLDVHVVSKIFGISPHELKSRIMKLKSLLRKNVSSFAERARKNIITYARLFGLPAQVVESALTMLSRLVDGGRIRFTPKTLALALIYVSLLKHSLPTARVTEALRPAKLKRIARYVCSQLGDCPSLPSTGQ